MKPLATLNRPVLQTVDVATKEEALSFKERTDVTAVPAMGVVAETMVALVLAGEALRKFGGDSLAELVRNRDAYEGALDETPSAAVAPPAPAPPGGADPTADSR
jgi:chorismate synthase